MGVPELRKVKPMNGTLLIFRCRGMVALVVGVVIGVAVWAAEPGVTVIEIDNVRVFMPGSSLEHIVPMPFVDKFGQYIHDDWPGKGHDDGEFHFGALDRGMFHQGLGVAKDQVDRGRKYAEYVKSVATSPLFVGCHWFLYFDQPLTGRSHDGENYSVGLVTVVDVPHETFLEAVRDVHAQVYTLGSGKQ
jgi:hypothetical protein